MYVTVPLPVPVCPAVIVTHAESLTAVWSQTLVLAATVIEPVPPAPWKLAFCGESVNVQLCAWVTVKL